MKRQLSTVVATKEPTKRTEAHRTGRIVRIDNRGRVWVDLGNGTKPQVSRISRTLACSNLVATDLAFREVLLTTDGHGNPVVIDFIEDRLILTKSTQEASSASPQDETVLDANRLLMRGKEQIVLSCGKATITLTQAGKIIIRGAYVSTSSSGVNRIRGGSVQLN